ncbi:hypothetical protein ASG90_02900 [Nocardioides sp. Soil797]|nr:hypothetical protein ASG90_02900 [Nocardioides sp. Soil797]
MWITLIVVILLLAGVLIWRGQGDSSDESSCDKVSSARLTASPDIASALTEAATELKDEGGCADIDVTAAPADEVLNQLVTRSGDPPDMWVPDSDVWAEQAAAGGVDAETVVPAVAASPVVLAGGPAADAPASWLAAATSGQLQMSDPLDSTPSALALIAMRAEKAKAGRSEAQLQTGLVTSAQQYSAESTGQGVSEALASVTASSKRVVPVTEQQFLVAKRDNQRLQVMVPETGTLMQNYPLLALPGHTEESRAALTEFLEFIQRPQGVEALADHGFRAGEGDPLSGERGIGNVAELDVPDAKLVKEDLRAWQVLAVPASLLVVLDASGSMDFETSDGTRMQLATAAAGKALSAYPDTTRIGLWLFSVDQGGPGVDHRVMAPLRRLDSKVKGVTQRDILGQKTTESLGLTNGGTGLYDTTLAAYRNALRNYDDDYFNSVVLMTDGANDDPGSIELGELLSTLRAEVDPAKPVRVIAIGISEDADMDALQKIADATGGQAFSARDPRDIMTVMSKSMLAR